MLIQHGATLARTLVVLPVAELDGAQAPADPGEVTRPGDQPIGLPLGLDGGAMASLVVGSGSIGAVHGPCPLLVAEPSG